MMVKHIYFSGSLYQEGELPANDSNNSGRAVEIYKSISSNTKQVNDAPEDGVNSCTVSFDTDGAGEIASQKVEEGAMATKPDNPSKEGKEFGGWLLNDVEFDFTTPIISSITLIAKWNMPLAIGDEVTFGEEQFFVVGKDTTNGTVDILAKYCLSKTDNVQLTKDATSSDYGRSFSSTNYWSSETDYPLDLQGEYLASHPLGETETEENNAIKKAQEYARAKRAIKGRLMTYEEANSLISSIGAILAGTWNDGTRPTENNYYWWLGTASDSYGLWVVDKAQRHSWILYQI